MEGQWNANDKELAEIKSIAEGDVDTPILMININKYNDGEYPHGNAYQDYMKILPKMLDKVGGKILWKLPALGQPVGSQAVDEILGIWDPSHKSFSALQTAQSLLENF